MSASPQRIRWIHCSVCREPFVPAATGRRRRYCGDACRMRAYRKRRKASPLLTSKTDEWSTPPEMFEYINHWFGPMSLDPCATAENAKCPRYFTRADDGLAQEWTGRVFMNPPYGRGIPNWIRKAWEASQTTAELVVCLVPARVDTRWWHDYAARGQVLFLPGRLRFGGAKDNAPFPSAVVVFRNTASVTEREGAPAL